MKRTTPDPWSPQSDLTNGHLHGPATTLPQDDATREFVGRLAPDFRNLGATGHAGCHHGGGCTCSGAAEVELGSEEEVASHLVEEAALRAIFPNDLKRRQFIGRVGKAAAVSLVGGIFPLDRMKAWAQEPVKGIEKKDLSIGFIPITCATPIIMAEPMGFYKKHGLNATVRKASGWAMVRDWAINGDVDAAHMLSPMPLSITLGAGSNPMNFLMPAVENINGQAITLANKHKNVKTAADMKGFRFCVPFDYSMHNYLLRYFLAEGGVDPDKDVQIRVVPPPEMVANLSAGNVDGYLAPDPFNQRAVYEKVGFLFKLTKDIWPGHPCCAFAISEEFTKNYPNTFKALFKSIVDATYFSSDPANRKEIAKAISPANYLNQPTIVLEQVLTGTYADGLGGIKKAPDRIDFDPVPWHSMAKWILSQMVRWGQVKPDVDYDAIAKRVYLESECADMIAGLGHEKKLPSLDSFEIMGKKFDPADPGSYAKSFAITRV